jgi:ATP-dependent protease ClpP protease subunit
MTDPTPPPAPQPPSAQELAKLEAEAVKLLAEARKVTAEAVTAEAEAEVAAIELAAAREKEAARCVSDDHCRVYRFNESVGQASADKCIATLARWHRLDPTCDIEIVFNSPGGSVIAGMALFDAIHRLSLRAKGGHKVTVGVAGYAALMAGILVQAADVRWIGRESYFMIHEVSAGTGGKIGEMKDDVKFYDAICDRVVKIFVARAGGKITKPTFERRWRRQDWWLLSDEALKLGFVDDLR